MIKRIKKTQSKPLSGVDAGELGSVEGFTNDVVANKLMSMGLLPGSTLRLLRKTFMGGTYYVKANNDFYLALRKNEAACILVKK